MDTFDINDWNSWYFGPMSRPEATEILMNEREVGIFLVRDSNSSVGDYVLCVREDIKVSNYIINKTQQRDKIVYRIGDQAFENLPKLLEFYTLHYLDTTPLRRPATRKLETVIAKFDFDGSDHDDLPFRRGEILTIIRKDEDQWWTAKNASGVVGQIPVPYVQKYDPISGDKLSERPSSGSDGNCVNNTFKTPRLTGVGCVGGGGFETTSSKRKLPAFARVKQSRVPNAYDKTALKLEVGDIIKVTKTNINGQWEGELKGKKGHFPFTHVEFINDNDVLSTTVSATAPTTATSRNLDESNNDWGE